MSQQSIYTFEEELDLVTKSTRSRLFKMIRKYFLSSDTLVFNKTFKFRETNADREKVVVEDLLGLSREKRHNGFYLNLVSESGKQKKLDASLLSFDELYELIGILLENYGQQNT